MEILRMTKGNTTYRIIANHPIWGIYEVERLSIMNHDDGTPCNVWKPALEGILKLFSTIEEAKQFIINDERL